ATAAAGSMFGMSWGEIACAGIISALMVGAAFLAWRSVSRRRRATACACVTAEGDGTHCDVGGACDPKAVQL
ncbi:MAG: hypothetical protein ACREDP_19355, partial [Bradyrhizobium sp.]